MGSEKMGGDKGKTALGGEHVACLEEGERICLEWRRVRKESCLGCSPVYEITQSSKKNLNFSGRSFWFGPHNFLKPWFVYF